MARIYRLGKRGGRRAGTYDCTWAISDISDSSPNWNDDEELEIADGVLEALVEEAKKDLEK